MDLQLKLDGCRSWNKDPDKAIFWIPRNELDQLQTKRDFRAVFHQKRSMRSNNCIPQKNSGRFLASLLIFALHPHASPEEQAHQNFKNLPLSATSGFSCTSELGSVINFVYFVHLEAAFQP